MATSNNDYLRFSAYSIKDLITRKLSDDSKFTDQVYEGSNLAILIDIVSYMYQCLLYNLNNAAAESMFSDTQIYENVSRLCKFIGYHPAGFKPSTLNIYIQNDPDFENKQIYPCSAIDTGLTDSEGKKIFFSTVFEQALNNQPVAINNNFYTNLQVINGRWRLYGTTFTANGTDYETFILDGVQSDSEAKKYVATNKIQVVVKSIETGKYDRWDPDQNEIFIQAYDSDNFDNSGNGAIFSKLYNENSKVYSVYLNENKTYEIKFGNGVLGKKLAPGDKVYVLYLDTNGPDGYIDISQLEWDKGIKFLHSPSFFDMPEEMYKAFFYGGKDSDDANIANVDKVVSIKFDPDSLTRNLPEESVQDIKNQAPNWFKTGNRLITKKDYEFFIKANNSDMFAGVVDVKCMNNWDYLTTFYRWLYNIGLNPIEYSKRVGNAYQYISKSRLIQNGYEYVDAADANNIYLWIASQNDNDILNFKVSLNNAISEIKTMTSETYPLKPIDVYFDISFTPNELYYKNLVENDGSNIADVSNSYLEVTMADNSVFSNTTILNSVAQIIEDSFATTKCTLGQVIDYSVILNKIYEINGVERVRTVYYPKDYLENENYQLYKTRACDGIAFASWSHTDLIDVGEDLQLNNTTRILEGFQFPKLVPGFDVRQKIKIIKKSMNTTNPVKF